MENFTLAVLVCLWPFAQTRNFFLNLMMQESAWARQKAPRFVSAPVAVRQHAEHWKSEAGIPPYFKGFKRVMADSYAVE